MSRHGIEHLLVTGRVIAMGGAAAKHGPSYQRDPGGGCSKDAGDVSSL